MQTVYQKADNISYILARLCVVTWRLNLKHPPMFYSKRFTVIGKISQKKAEYLQKFVNLFKDAPEQTGRFNNINVHNAK